MKINKLNLEAQTAFEQAGQTKGQRRNEQVESALLDNVTHNLRTPLTSIKAAATTLLEDLRGRMDEQSSADGSSLQLDDQGREEFLEIINEETDRLNEFIGGIISLAKIEAGELNLRRNRSEVEEIINNAVARMKNRFDSHQVLIEIENEIPAVLTDAESISEVIYRLLENAAKFSPESSKIIILARRTKNETVEIGVEDCGRGIEKEMREKVFDKFFQIAESDIHNTSNGLGIGLAIARGIVESHGGKIWIEDGQDGYATRAAFQIPISGDKPVLNSDEIK